MDNCKSIPVRSNRGNTNPPRKLSMRTTLGQYKSLQLHHLLIKFHKSVNGFSNFNQIKKTHFRKLQIPLEITNFGTPKCELFLLSFRVCVKQNLVYLGVCFSKITVKISIICIKSTWITELIKENILIIFFFAVLLLFYCFTIILFF